jgi:methyl-accepting chemotaxis protein
MKKEKRGFTIRKKLLVSFLIILLIPSITIGYTSFLNAQDKVKEKIQMSAKENVNTIDRLVTSYITPKTHDISYYSQIFNQKSFNSQDIQTTMNSFQQYKELRPEVAGIYIGSEKKDFLIYPHQDVSADYDPRERPWYIEAKKKEGQTIITEPYIDAFTGKVLITIAQTLNDGSGVIGIDLDLDALKNVTSGIKIGREGYPAILSAQGMYLVHPTEKPGTKIKGSFVKKLLEKNSGVISYDLNSNKKEMIFKSNTLTGFKIIGTMDLAEVNQDTNPILKTTFLIVGIFVLIGILVSYFIVQSITRPLNQLVSVTEKVSNGDLTQNFVVKNNDEISKVGISFNRMVSSLHDIIQHVGEKATLLAASSEELMASSEQNNEATEQVANAIQEVASGTEKQSSMLNESTIIMKEISTKIEQIMKHSQIVAVTAVNAAETVSNGQNTIQLSTKQMEIIHDTVHNLGILIQKLESRSNEINQIIDVISNIAAQTNLLALNAAIEAARAGEHGKGFAVVADEVRKLAEQSAESTENIRQLISSIQTDTNQAVISMGMGTTEVKKGIELVQDAGDAFRQIQEFVDHVTSEFQEVSASIQETADGTTNIVEIVNGIEEIATKTTAESQDVSAATEEQMASMQEIAASASSLANMAEELQDSIRKFTI